MASNKGILVRATIQGFFTGLLLYGADVFWSVVGRDVEFSEAVVSADAFFSVCFGFYVGFAAALVRLNKIRRSQR